MRRTSLFILSCCVAFGLTLSPRFAHTAEVCQSVALKVGGVSIVNQQHRATDEGFLEFLIKATPFEGKVDMVTGQSIRHIFQPLIKQLQRDHRITRWNYDVYIAHTKANPVHKLQMANVVSSYRFAANPVAFLQAGVSAKDMLTSMLTPATLYYYAGSPIIEALLNPILPHLNVDHQQIVALRKPCRVKGQTHVEEVRQCQYMMWRHLFETAWAHRPAYAVLGLHPYLQYRAMAQARGEQARAFVPILVQDARILSPLAALVAHSGSKREACAQALGRYLSSDEAQARIPQYRFADFPGQVWWPRQAFE